MLTALLCDCTAIALMRSFVAVGATMVGSIVWTMREGDQVKK
jgi:hypothetical protein